MSQALYSKLNDADLERGLDIQHQDAPPTYPPGPQYSGRRMNYVFNPTYPIKGKSAKVVGRACASKEETLDVVKEAFPALQRYPDDRLTFHILTDGEGVHKSYSQLLDDGWVDILSHPPPGMLIKVEDAPGDSRKRTLMQVAVILAGPLALMLLFGCLIFFVSDV